MTGVPCYKCGIEYQPTAEAMRVWAESGRQFEPTDWECPECDWVEESEREERYDGPFIGDQEHVGYDSPFTGGFDGADELYSYPDPGLLPTGEWVADMD